MRILNNSSQFIVIQNWKYFSFVTSQAFKIFLQYCIFSQEIIIFSVWNHSFKNLSFTKGSFLVSMSSSPKESTKAFLLSMTSLSKSFKLSSQQEGIQLTKFTSRKCDLVLRDSRSMPRQSTIKPWINLINKLIHHWIYQWKLWTMMMFSKRNSQLQSKTKIKMLNSRNLSVD